MGMNEEDYCSICGRPRRIVVKLGDDGAYRRVNCMCDCEREALEEYERQFRDAKKKREATHLKLHSFYDDDLANNDASIRARSYASLIRFGKDRAGVCILGDVEQGKTFFAEAILNEVQKDGHPVGVLRYIDWKTDITDFLTLDTLLIDDLDKFVSESEWRRLFAIIDEAYRNGQRLIVTANLTVEEIVDCENYLKKAVYSRILEMCYLWKLDTGRVRNVKGQLGGR